MNRQLYRSRSNRMLAGVCGGLAEYFNIDPTIVRILWALFAFYGVGVIAYIIAVIVIPEGSYDTMNYGQQEHPINIDNTKVSIIIGSALILLGILVLGKHFFPRIDYKLIWPLVLIALGALVLVKGGRKS